MVRFSVIRLLVVPTLLGLACSTEPAPCDAGGTTDAADASDVGSEDGVGTIDTDAGFDEPDGGGAPIELTAPLDGVVWQQKHEILTKNWEEAAAYCAAAGLRLPSKDQLVALGNWALSDVEAANLVFPGNDLWDSFYWSSTPAEGQPGKSWNVFITRTGVVDATTPVEISLVVRCIE